MENIKWKMKGTGVNNCNCNYGCPCQFNSLPTHGDCRAYTAMHIDEGHFGDVRLDGLNWVMTWGWPGAVHQGNGTCQAIIDERADKKQREALTKILHGEESEPGSTFLHVFSTTMSKTHEPLFKPIELSADIDARTASLRVPGVVEASVEPIVNAKTGQPTRSRIDLPNGFEFKKAEVASGKVKATGDVNLDLDKTHCHLAEYHLTSHGIA
jgi:hypothetical protein